MMTAELLKASILQLAMQGKLVEQRAEEGTGERLYEEMLAEKNRLIKAKKIKKGKALKIITENDYPFDIPETWRWVRLGDVSSYAQKKEKVSPGDITPEMWSLDLEDIEKGTGKVLNRVSARDRKIKGEKVRFASGNILYSKLRPYLLKILIADADGITTPELVPFDIYGPHDSKFFLWYLRSPYVDNEVNSVSYGVKMPRVGTDTMTNLMVPLPPLAEQKRIVTRIEELMPFVEQYADASTKLNMLNTSFPDMMKKSILQEAVQGKLVSQDPNDEPASGLLKRIAEEKQRLIKEGKIKKQKALPEITENEIPFDIPESWEWVRLQDLFYKIEAGKSKKCHETPPDNDKTGIIKVSAVTWGEFQENESKTCLSDSDWNSEYEIKKNDFLITRANTKQLVGACVIVKTITKRLMLSDKTLRLVFSDLVNDRFLLYCLRSNYLRVQIEEKATGTSDSMKNVSQKAIGELIIALPPVSEQERIVKEFDRVVPELEELINNRMDVNA